MQIITRSRTSRKVTFWLVVTLLALIMLIVAFGYLYLKYIPIIRKYEKEESAAAQITQQIDDDVKTAEVDIDLINEDIQGIGELSTAEYIYTDAGSFTDSKKIKGVNIPFSSKSFIMKWDGSIKAGIDASKIKTSYDEGSKTITVTLPEAKILSHTIDDESVVTLDEKNNVFNPIKVEDVNTLLGDSKAAMEDRAVGHGLLDTAYENAKPLILDLMNAIPDVEGNIAIVFR